MTELTELTDLTDLTDMTGKVQIRLHNNVLSFNICTIQYPSISAEKNIG